MKVRNGIDHLRDADALLKGKRIGLITSSAGVSAELVHNTEIFKQCGYQITVLLAPEHGVWGNIPAGEFVEDGKDPISGLPVSSLYAGERKHIKEEVLEGLDIVVYDIQDVGCRFYTYLSLLHHVMEDCKKGKKPLLILDRINPLGGTVMGNLLPSVYFSYVGVASIPQRHGMTVGELAKMFDEEIGLGSDLHILPVEGWKREMLFPETGLPFIPPSPNIPNFETALVYSGFCLLEGVNISEGRGTTLPFLQAGAPYIRAKECLERLREWDLKGVLFTPAFFTPTASKYQGELCEGIQIHVTDDRQFHPIEAGLCFVAAVCELYPEHFKILPPPKEGGRSFFSLLTGTELFGKDNRKIDEVLSEWRKESVLFEEMRIPYLRY